MRILKKKECKHPMQYRVWTIEGMACDYCGVYQSDFKKPKILNHADNHAR